MEFTLNQIHKLLLEKRKTVAVAESCSGGLLSKFLTDISGSSQYFILGIVAYSDKAKEKILGIPSRMIKKEGAVSKTVASLMAQNVRKLAKTNFGIGITGIAGPAGAKPHKPVGTVFIAVDNPNKKICERFQFKGKRPSIRKKTALKALELFYESIYCH